MLHSGLRSAGEGLGTDRRVRGEWKYRHLRCRCLRGRNCADARIGGFSPLTPISARDLVSRDSARPRVSRARTRGPSKTPILLFPNYCNGCSVLGITRYPSSLITLTRAPRYLEATGGGRAHVRAHARYTLVRPVPTGLPAPAPHCPTFHPHALRGGLCPDHSPCVRVLVHTASRSTHARIMHVRVVRSRARHDARRLLGLSALSNSAFSKTGAHFGDSGTVQTGFRLVTIALGRIFAFVVSSPERLLNEAS